jgi:hypothetical protein
VTYLPTSSDLLSEGNIPHGSLVDCARAYNKLIDQDLEIIDFSLLYVEGVRLANAKYAADKEIVKGELPPLDATARETLDTLLQVHGTFIMATVEGIEAITAEERYRRTVQEEVEYRAAAVAFVQRLQGVPDVIDPHAASIVLGAAEEIGKGSNPERSGVVATGAVKNVAITLSAAATLVTLPVLAALTGSTIAMATSAAALC